MGKIYKSASELIGNTPLIRLCGIEEKYGLDFTLIAKLEGANPAGSAKDRVALQMIEDAEKDGRLKPGSTIIEPTSGNTGIGLAAICAQKGYRLIIVMPDSMSKERIKTIAAYGAEIKLTDGKKGMSGAIALAEELAREMPDSIIAGQFTNPSNPLAHYNTTGPEIYRDTDGEIDVFVAGIGTGGTISGVGKYLKEKNPKIQIIGAEPDTSAVINGDTAGAHGLQGIGAGFIPQTLDLTVVDRVMRITDEEAYELARCVAAREGLLVGISSGAALAAAIKLGARGKLCGMRVVVLLPDSGDRYLSTDLFS